MLKSPADGQSLYFPLKQTHPFLFGAGDDVQTNLEASKIMITIDKYP